MLVSEAAVSGGVVPGSSRILDTSQGLVRVEFGTTTAAVIGVGADGWLPVPTFGAHGAARRIGRSLPAVASALREFGLPDAEATRLAEQALRAWEAIPVPPPRTLLQRARRILNLLWLTLSILVGLIGRVVVRPFRNKQTHEEPPRREGRPTVAPSSGEYGTLRIVHTSLGWAEFEFWSEWSGRVGIYGLDGWLPFMASKRPGFDGTEDGAIAALLEQGVPHGEAEELGRLVLRERLTRIGGGDEWAR